jgi:hypothetical protein
MAQFFSQVLDFKGQGYGEGAKMWVPKLRFTEARKANEAAGWIPSAPAGQSDKSPADLSPG